MQAIASGLNVCFLASPAPKKSLRPQFRRKPTELVCFLLGKISLRYVLACKFRSEQFDINADLTLDPISITAMPCECERLKRTANVESGSATAGFPCGPYTNLIVLDAREIYLASKSRRIPRAAMK